MPVRRADQILARLMEAHEHGDPFTVASLARDLRTLHPELRGWCAYVIAGCHALRGDAAEGLRTLREADAAGEWWAEPLLQDPALTTIWPLDHEGLRTRSLRRARTAAESAVITWDAIPGKDPTIISLHGNGPAPADLFRTLWSELDGHRTVLVRSPQLVASHVREWRDVERAAKDVRTVISAYTDSPIILAGLGAGGRLAVNTALAAADQVIGAVAFAPTLDAPPHPIGAPDTRIWLFPGGSSKAIRSCDTFEVWAKEHGIECTVRHEPGLGHAYPTRFAHSVLPAIAAIAAGRIRTSTTRHGRTIAASHQHSGRRDGLGD